MDGNVDRSQRVTTPASFLLVSAMLACLTASFVQVGEIVMPGWQGNYLVWLAFIVALMSVYGQRLRMRSRDTRSNSLVYWFTEIVILLIVLKIAYYFSVGFRQFYLDLFLWQEDFMPSFFSGEYLFGILIVFLVWIVARIFSSELSVLEVTEASLRSEMESGIFDQRPAARERLVNTFLGFGILMVFLAALLRMDLLANWFDLPEMRAGVVNLLAYFLLGLVLLSLTQFNLMRANWLMDRLPIQKEIARQWILYSFVFILIVALISSILPTSYSLGLLSLLRYVFLGFIALITFLFSMISFPFIFLVNLILSLLGSRTELAPMGPAEIPRYEPPPSVAEQAPLPWLEMLKSILFWLVFLAVIGFALYYYAREHEELLTDLRRFPLFSSLERFWTWLQRQVGAINHQLVGAVDESFQRLKERLRRKPDKETWGFINPRDLSPRQRVFFYYLAMVRRGGEKGIQRHPSQTPFEYSQALSNTLQTQNREFPNPEVMQEIDRFTGHFVEARYSQHEITDQEVSLVRRYWQHIRTFLRGKKSL